MFLCVVEVMEVMGPLDQLNIMDSKPFKINNATFYSLSREKYNEKEQAFLIQ